MEKYVINIGNGFELQIPIISDYQQLSVKRVVVEYEIKDFKKYEWSGETELISTVQCKLIKESK